MEMWVEIVWRKAPGGSVRGFVLLQLTQGISTPSMNLLRKSVARLLYFTGWQSWNKNKNKNRNKYRNKNDKKKKKNKNKKNNNSSSSSKV